MAGGIGLGGMHALNIMSSTSEIKRITKQIKDLQEEIADLKAKSCATKKDNMKSFYQNQINRCEEKIKKLKQKKKTLMLSAGLSTVGAAGSAIVTGMGKAKYDNEKEQKEAEEMRRIGKKAEEHGRRQALAWNTIDDINAGNIKHLDVDNLDLDPEQKRQIKNALRQQKH